AAPASSRHLAGLRTGRLRDGRERFAVVAARSIARAGAQAIQIRGCPAQRKARGTTQTPQSTRGLSTDFSSWANFSVDRHQLDVQLLELLRHDLGRSIHH